MPTNQRPPVPPEIDELFIMRVRGADEGRQNIYRPALFGIARLHFVDARAGVDCWRSVATLARVGEAGASPWHDAETVSCGEYEISEQPREGLGFAPLSGKLARPKSYATWVKSLAAHLSAHHTLSLWRAPVLKEISKADESEADFRVRLVQQNRELRDEAVAKLRRTYGSKGAVLDERIQKARERVAREKSEFQSSSVDTAVSLGSSLLRAFLGRKLASVTNVRNATSTARRASRAAKQHGDIARAQKELDRLLEERAKLEDKFEEELARVKSDYAEPQIEPYSVRPRKRDIAVERVSLAWVS